MDEKNNWTTRKNQNKNYLSGFKFWKSEKSILILDLYFKLNIILTCNPWFANYSRNEKKEEEARLPTVSK